VQLRPENKERTCYNLVGFQTQLKIGDQKRIFRMIPGLEDAEFYRYGSIHRNSYINSPKLLTASLQTKQREDLFFAGQLTGVEGYVENIATGLMAGINMVRWLHGKAPINLPVNTAMEALLRYITTANPEKFQPMNVNFGLLPPLKKRIRNKKERKKAMVDRAIEEMKNWMSSEV
jgi:methylenetetrahydrofolate--tRNA-(uracil-5-)-methyltransferase